MKTLLKISLCFVLCLFVSASVSAEGLSDTEGGTITVTVVKSLAIDVLTPDASFIYDEHGSTTTVGSKTAGVTVDASCDWTFSVNANGPALVAPGVVAPIALNKISYVMATEASALLTETGTSFDGGLNDTFDVVWSADLALGNIYAGLYTVGVTYKVVER